MTVDDYQASTVQFASELRGLFAPGGESTRLGRPGTASPAELVDRADRVLVASERLTRAAAQHLQAEDPAIRLGAECHLLAQAAALVQAADGLLAAAAAAGEAEPAEATRIAAAARPTADLDELLALLETPLSDAGVALQFTPAATRAGGTATPVELLTAAEQVLNQVLQGVAEFGQDTLAGLMGLDTALIKQAAGMISSELEEFIRNISEQASHLIARALTFLIKAYDSLLAAMGEDAASVLRQQAAEWLQQLQEGEALASLLAALLQVAMVQDQVQTLVQTSQAPGPILEQVRQSVVALPDAFQQRVKLPRQVLAGLGIVRRFPAVRTPLGELASAILYVTLFGFTLFVGADYVDAPTLKRLDRVPGVLRVVESGLTGD